MRSIASQMIHAQRCHQPRFAKRGEVFKLAVAVGVVFVGRLVAYLYGEEGQRHAHQVKARGAASDSTPTIRSAARPPASALSYRGGDHGVQRHAPFCADMAPTLNAGLETRKSLRS